MEERRLMEGQQEMCFCNRMSVEERVSVYV